MADILLVEDEAGLRDLVAEALSDFGHWVTIAENGVVALRHLEKGRFDVVVTDVSMPEGVSGIELANEIRLKYPESKVILVSGHARAQLKELPDNATFLPKPYRIHQLLQLLPDG
jgi:DNA-binding NtrC family response regulator